MSGAESAPLPRWLVAVGSVLIGYHLLAVAATALAAPSGPWPGQEGGMYTPPQFARTAYDDFAAGYLGAVRMTHNYHFPSNRPVIPGAYFVARLRDKDGAETATVTVPDPTANGWVRAREAQLALSLADDQPVPPPTGEVIAAPNQAAPSLTVWSPAGPRNLRLANVPQHLLPRDRPVFRPSDWSLVLARSYARHLCRTHGAASAEIVRHWKEPIPPAILGAESVPPDAFGEIVSTFGETGR